MKKVLLLMILSIGLIFCLAPNTNAGFNFGIRYLSLTAQCPPGLGFHLGADLGENAVILGGLELLRESSKKELTGAGPYSYKDESATTVFTPFFGGKYYFKSRSSGEVSFYISALFFKSFASVNIDTGDPDADKYDEELYKELASPFGFNPAFGAEYYFSDYFAIGGETGLKFSSAKAEVKSGSTTYEESHSSIDHYFSITLNFRVK